MEISISTRQAYSEIDTFLNLLNEEKRNQIPKKLRELFKEEKDKEYIKEINIDIPIREQNLKEETLSIIALLNLQYWCKDEEEKQRLKDIYAENEQKYQEELREKYNPDNIFKKNISKIPQNEIEENTENMQMIEYKESIFKKIFSKIKSIFWRNKI